MNLYSRVRGGYIPKPENSNPPGSRGIKRWFVTDGIESNHKRKTRASTHKYQFIKTAKSLTKQRLVKPSTIRLRADAA